MNRNETIERIRGGLKRRSGKSWSVTGGRGTAWGWITIDAPPARRTWQHIETGRMRPDHPHLNEYTEIPMPPDSKRQGHTSPAERAELQKLLGLTDPVHFQGIGIPDSFDYWQEYVDRAEGRTPSVLGRPYWD